MGPCFLVCHSLGDREAEAVGREDPVVPECSGGWVPTTCFCLAHGTAILLSPAGSGQGQDSWHTHRLYPREPCQGDGTESLLLSFCPLYVTLKNVQDHQVKNVS